jgi:hypothetical protein
MTQGRLVRIERPGDEVVRTRNELQQTVVVDRHGRPSGGRLHGDVCRGAIVREECTFAADRGVATELGKSQPCGSAIDHQAEIVVRATRNGAARPRNPVERPLEQRDMRAGQLRPLKLRPEGAVLEA